MKITLRRLLIFLLILALSVAFGFGFDAVMTAIDKGEYPLRADYADAIRDHAQHYAIPEAILWATVRTASNFQSNLLSEDGSIGLMQLTPSEFEMITVTILKEEPSDAGMLYSPDKNLQCGAAYLSYLYQRFGVWETAFAAYAAGEETVREWLKDKAYSNDMGTLYHIPDAATADFVARVTRAQQYYTKLYFKT